VVALVASVTLALAALAVAETVAAPAARADSVVVVFDSVPSTLPQNWASQGAQAYSMKQFGQRVQLDGASRNISSITVGFSSWACESWATPSDPCLTTTPGASFELPITVNLYAVGSSGTVGGLVASTTRTVSVPFRPSPTGDCTGGRWSADGGVTCSAGVAFTADFGFSPAPFVPSDLIVGVVYNTQSHGPAPYGVAGPYDSFNVGLEGDLTVGSVADADNSVYIDSGWKGAYTSDESGSGIADAWVSTFHAGALWSPYSPIPLRINAVAPLAPDAPPPAPPTLPADDTPPPTPSTVGADGDPITAPVLPPAPPPAGGSVPVVYADGTFLPYEWVHFVFYSTPTFSSSLQANATGGLTGAVSVPASIPAGAHTLAATGATSGTVSTAGITVTAALALAATGVDRGRMLLLTGLGAVTLLWGVVALAGVAVRRRARIRD